MLQKRILVSIAIGIFTIIALLANLGNIITFFMGFLSNPYTGLLITNQNNFSTSHVVVIYNDGNKIDDYITFQISVENPYVKIVKIEQKGNVVANPSFTSGSGSFTQINLQQLDPHDWTGIEIYLSSPSAIKISNVYVEDGYCISSINETFNSTVPSNFKIPQNMTPIGQIELRNTGTCNKPNWVPLPTILAINLTDHTSEILWAEDGALNANQINNDIGIGIHTS